MARSAEDGTIGISRLPVRYMYVLGSTVVTELIHEHVEASGTGPAKVLFREIPCTVISEHAVRRRVRAKVLFGESLFRVLGYDRVSIVAL